ncbi:ATP-binding protein [Streptacidiphilus jiangxiensis]|uniref:Tetratricopeptide repeat-containing protein n=1 Tax=Streptacidiphilus jiangxiensis TaxID=235985 RepID=A0A1H7WH08_STRJI|nr:helix-turn-helix domain-containing protein [Streptacidiphilus jiangxiensis]SEM20395.1 Tetratricopeptide repeat-containing protein [Streptacidiphilus jiangxiensis]
MEQTTFGELLRQGRKRSGLTLDGLAAASGVSVRAIGDMERGRSLPRQSTLSELLNALDLDEAGRRRLESAAHGNGPAPAHHVPRQLPPDLRTFRGRQDALARVLRIGSPGDDAGTGHPPVAAIGGMAGVGKTSLAVHWAHRVADRFPDGQLYVNLRGFDPSAEPLDPHEALGGFLIALGVPGPSLPTGTEERSALFRARVANLRMVVVLDNARDSRQVRPLLPRTPGCLTVITSRNQLTALAASEEAELVDLGPWTGNEAVDVLSARIGAERTVAEPASAAMLTKLCGGLPLAVAILGAHLAAQATLSLRVAADELAGTQPRLDAFSTDDPHTDLRAVFSWSCRALDPASARLFRHLPVLPGPVFSAAAAASTAGEPLASARRLLHSLTAASLLTRDADGNFVLHDLVREYAADLLGQEGDDRHAAELRLLGYLRHNARAAVQVLETRHIVDLDQEPNAGVVLLPFDNREQALAWFRQEERTILTAVRTTDDPRLLHFRLGLAQDCIPYFSAQGQWADEITMQRLALDAALLLDDAVEVGNAAAALARALAEIGRGEEADQLIDLIEQHLNRLPLLKQAQAQRSIGWVRGRQRRHQEALDHASAALAIYRTLADPDLVARELNAVGWYLTLLGRHPEAVASCREALPLLQQTGNRFSEAATWDSIGYALYHLGEYHDAVRHFENALRLYEEVLNPYNQAEVLDHLAEVHVALGDGGAARASWLRAADLLSGSGNARAEEMRARADNVT